MAWHPHPTAKMARHPRATLQKWRVILATLQNGAASLAHCKNVHSQPLFMYNKTLFRIFGYLEFKDLISKISIL